MTPAMWALGVAVAYLCGSLPTGVLVAKAKGVDLTKAGSGNIGATNAARVLGRPLGVFVLLVDAAKSFVPVLFASHHHLEDRHGAWFVTAVAFAAILGHVFPVWLKFRGGKGVATAFGAFLAVAPVAAAVAFVTYALVFAIWRVSSIGSLTSATVFVATMAVLRAPAPFVALACLAWLLIVVRHRDNIRRIFRKEEQRLP